MGADSEKDQISKALIGEFESKLKDMRKRLAGDLQIHSEEIKESVSARPADELTLKDDIDAIEREDSMEGAELNLVENAMQRIRSGNYGYCLKCRQRIPLERLRAIPYAEYCVPCKEQQEKLS